MSPTSGSGPFDPGGGAFDVGPLPERVRYREPWPRRRRAVVSGGTVLDGRRGVVLYEGGAFPVHHFPLADVRREPLDPAEPDPRAAAARWSLRLGERLVPRCVAGSPRGADGGELPAGHVAVDHGAMDRWFEEDDPSYAHPRDPYHRVGVRASSRRVDVRHDGPVVAGSDRPKLLFETAVPIRYHLPFGDVRSALLAKGETVPECPYKGDGQHRHLRVGGDEVGDAARSLPHPLPEGFAAAEHVCFSPDKVEIEVDGARLKD